MVVCRRVGNHIPSPRETWLVRSALEAAGVLLTTDGQPFHRDYAAVVLAKGGNAYNNNRGYEEFIKTGILWEAWIGNIAAVLQAKRDYLDNARHKAFTSWRLDVPNGNLVTGRDFQPVSDDSVWPGATTHPGKVAAVSALLPHEDEMFSDLIGGVFRVVNGSDISKYASYSPEPGIDTFGGLNFDRPPEIWW